MTDTRKSSWLRDTLQRVAETNTGPAAKVVSIRSVDKLMEDIRATINQKVEAECERARIEAEQEQANRHFAEKLAEIDAETGEIRGRLLVLQKQLAAAVVDCGIKAEVIA